MTALDSHTDGYLIDTIFVDMMENGNNENTTSNRYLVQFVDKFKFFRIESPVTFFEISIKDLTKESICNIDSYIKGCKSEQEKYRKLDGIFTEVIARIAKQAEPSILSLTINEDPVLLKTSLNQIREIVSLKWKIVK